MKQYNLCCKKELLEERHAMKDFFTTTEVARMLGLHANTLKNWVREGKLQSFRTIGGHYRIRADVLAETLRSKGIPVPPELEKRKQSMFVVHPEESMREKLIEEIKKSCDADIAGFSCGVDALLSIGGRAPGVVLWYTGLQDVDAASLRGALGRNENTKSVNFIMIHDAQSSSVPEVAASASVPIFRYPENMSELLKKIQKSNF